MADGDQVPPNERVIKFGGRNKLTADWPFFHLFWYWQEALKGTDILWVIGYSFHDDHINAAIANWFGSDPNRRMAIVDPGFSADTDHPLHPYIITSSTDSPDQMVPTPNTEASFKYAPLRDDDIRIAILRAGAGAALQELEQKYPALPNEFARSTKISL